MKLTIKNYRCFSENNPAVIEINKGFISFIGVNNSGKSTLLKFFYEFRHLFQTFSSPHSFHQALRGPQAINIPNTVFDIEELFSNLNNNNIEITIEKDVSDASISPQPTKTSFTFIVQRNSPNVTAYIYIDEVNIPAENIRVTGDIFECIRPITLDLKFIFPFLSELGDTLYIGPFRNTINVGTKTDYYDIKVGESFIQEWRRLKEGKSKREKHETIRLEEEIRRIFSFNSLQINPSDDNQTLSVVVDGQPYMLPELGSGLAQFIMVFANAAMRRPRYILIDEPELNLHPTLQLDFLTTLASYATAGIIFATHSIGLAKASSDTVYTVKKISPGNSEVKELGDVVELPEFLGELSYSGYKELGLDTVLLLEGPKDIRVVQQFLKLLKKEHKIVMIPLGGGSIINAKTEIELKEIKRLSPNMHVIIDSEKTTADEALSSSIQGFVDNCKKYTIDCHVLTLRATENYLSDIAVKKVKGSGFRALAPYEKLSDMQPHWDKEENWMIAKEMSQEDLLKTDLGIFLNKL